MKGSHGASPRSGGASAASRDPAGARTRAWLWFLLFVHLGVSPLLFSQATLEAFDYPKALLLQGVALLAISCSIAAGLSFGPSRLARDPLALGVTAFGASAALSTLLSLSPRTSWNGAPESFVGLPTVLSYVALFFATRAACASRVDARRLLLAPVLGAATAAAYGLVQAAGLDAFTWQRLSSFGGMRPFGTLGHANTLSAYLTCAWPIAACFALAAWWARWRWAALGFGVVSTAAACAVVLSRSRAGWLGLMLAVVGLAVVLGRTGERRTAHRLLAGAAGCAAAGIILALLLPDGRALLGTLQERLRGLGELRGRRLLWRTAVEAFRQHPLTGAGLDTFALFFAPRRTPEFWLLEWNTVAARAHNEALQLLATQGLLGAAAAATVLWGLCRAAAASWRNQSPEDRPLVNGALVGLAAFGAAAAFGFTQAAPGALVVTLLALVSVAARPDVHAAAPATSPALVSCAARTVGVLSLSLPILALGRSAWAGALPTAATLAAFALPVALALLPGVTGETRQEAREQGVAAAGRSGLARLALAAAVAATLGFVLIVKPAAANVACAAGARLLAVSLDAAVREHERAVSLDPSQPLYWSRLGLAAQAAARQTPDAAERALRLARARGAFTRAASLEPLDAQHDMLLCRVVAEQALAGGATSGEVFSHCDRAIEREPANPYFHTVAAHAGVQLGELGRARRYAERGARLYPRLGAFRYQLGFIALSEGRLEEAERELRAALLGDWYGQESGRDPARIALAEVYRRLGRAAEAERLGSRD